MARSNGIRYGVMDGYMPESDAPVAERRKRTPEQLEAMEIHRKMELVRDAKRLGDELAEEWEK